MADEENENEEAQEEEEEGADAGEEDAEGESDGEEGEEGGDKPKKKKGGGKLKLIIIAVVVLILIAVPAALFFTGKLDSLLGKTEDAGGEEVEGALEEEGADSTVYYDMEEFVVNLSVGSKRPSFLKMTVSLELPSELQIPRIEAKMPRIRDGFQIYLRELRQEDLQGSAGLYRLREELLLRTNKIVYPGKVNDILFKEILVQ